MRCFLAITAFFTFALSGAGGLSAADDLTVDRDGAKISVCGRHFRLIFDAAQGGEMTDVRLRDGSRWNRVVGGDEQSFPMVALRDETSEYALTRDKDAKIMDFKATPDVVSWKSVGTPCTADGRKGPWQVSLAWEVHAAGAVFCELEYALPDDGFVLKDSTLGFAVDAAVSGLQKYRQDDKPRPAAALPSARVAFGVNPSRSFSNEIEVIVEDNRPMAGSMDYACSPGRFLWRLGDGDERLAAGYRYINRVAIGLGAAAVGKPRTNLIGQRIYHWINYLDRQATAAWFPSNRQIDRMADNGATMLILHQDWMLQSGANGDPHADYETARDEESLRRVIDHAHEHGMRVGLYRRGIERYSLGRYFDKYLKRNWDGLYVDWHGTHSVAHHESRERPETDLGDRHFSTDGGCLPAREYFLFTKQLREEVGADGFLIGHMGIGNSGILANLLFDAYLPGESGSDHRMFCNRDDAVFRGMTGGVSCMPWPLDSPLFSSREGIAKMAAWGFFPHVGLGLQRKKDGTLFSLDPDDEINCFALPYWRVLRSIDAERARIYNQPSENLTAVEFSNPDFDGVVYKCPDINDINSNDSGTAKYLVVLSNLGSKPGATTVTLNPQVLGLSGNYRVTRINSQTGGRTALEESKNTAETGRLQPWEIEGLLFERE